VQMIESKWLPLPVGLVTLRQGRRVLLRPEGRISVTFHFSHHAVNRYFSFNAKPATKKHE
jgi:hypothetical protein